MSKLIPIVVTLALFAAMATLYKIDHNKHSSFLNGVNVEGTFQLWMKAYNKHYTPEEYAYRLQIFTANLIKVIKHQDKYQSGESTYEIGLNQFADIDGGEFKAFNKGLVIPKEIHSNGIQIPISYPAAIDWTTKGAVTPVKNQGQCGSCYTFSSTGGLEARHFLDTGSLISFSEQQLVDCSGSYGTMGCNGGWMDWCFNYTLTYGIEPESVYPYTAIQGTCVYNAASEVWKNSGYIDVTPANNSNAFLSALAIQPISVAIDASGDGFQLYTSGIYSDPNCGTSLDHAVLAVGYGSNFIKVKNSWGTSWGEEGYILFALDIGTNIPGQCGIYMHASYPTGKSS